MFLEKNVKVIACGAETAEHVLVNDSFQSVMQWWNMSPILELMIKGKLRAVTWYSYLIISCLFKHIYL